MGRRNSIQKLITDSQLFKTFDHFYNINDYINDFTLIILTIDNYPEWQQILSTPKNEDKPVYVAIPIGSDIELKPNWKKIEIPNLIESFFSNLADLQKTGEWILPQTEFPHGLTDLKTVVNKINNNSLDNKNQSLIVHPNINSQKLTEYLNIQIQNLDKKNNFVEALFIDLDTDNSGEISAEEFKNAMVGLGVKNPDELMEQLDSDNSGGVDLNEFSQCIEEKHHEFVKESLFKVNTTVLFSQQKNDIEYSRGRTPLEVKAIQDLQLKTESIQVKNIQEQSIVENWFNQNIMAIIGVSFLPGLGIMRKRQIEIDNKIGVLQFILDSQNRRLILRRTEDGTFFETRIDSDEQKSTRLWKKGNRQVEMKLNPKNEILGLKVNGKWAGRSKAMEAMLNSTIQENAQLDLFERDGVFGGTHKKGLDIICRCIQARESDVYEWVKSGLDTVETLSKEHGLGQVCGGCNDQIEKVIEGEKSDPVLMKIGNMEVPQIVAESFDSFPTVDVEAEAESFILQLVAEGKANRSRLSEVLNEIESTGTWTPTSDEITWGARIAWRNSTRCVGRYFWETLQVFDCRNITDEDEMFKAILKHLEYGTNGGDLRATMSVFAPANNDGVGPRLWNSQLIRYAGYKQKDGSILGDPANVELTEMVQNMGWKIENPGNFDVLPLVIEMPGKKPKMYEIPKDLILEVPIRHPENENIEKLKLKWYALPAVSNLSLEMGGITFTMIPFNGFYMNTEIGARNFTDKERYNLLPEIADALNLDRSEESNLWRDSAQVEINRAILYSFEKDNVRMMDHHAITQYFLKFEKEEKAFGRDVFAEWAWIVPPIAGSATDVYLHEHWENRILKPGLFYLPDIHKPTCPMGHGTPAKDKKERCPFTGK